MDYEHYHTHYHRHIHVHETHSSGDRLPGSDRPDWGSPSRQAPYEPDVSAQPGSSASRGETRYSDHDRRYSRQPGQ